MTTKLEICNSAIIRCGGEIIADINEENKRAKLVKSQYEIVLRELLNDTTWNFATKRATVSGSTTPLYGYAFAHDLPCDCIRVLSTENDSPYRIEGVKFMTNCEEVNIKYIYFNDCPEQYTPTFVKAFYMKLAESMAYALVQSASLQQAIVAEAERHVRLARSYNSQEGTPADRYPEGYTIGLRL